MKLLNCWGKREGKCLLKCLELLLVFIQYFRKDIYKEKYDKEYEVYWTSMLENGMIASNDKKIKKIRKNIEN